MRTRVGLLVTCGAILALCGCAGNSVIAHKTTRAAKWYGDVGITGHQNVLTIEKNSLVFELSIMGDNNEVIVEDGASLAKIEIWGSNNTVTLPDGMHPKYRSVGDNNKVQNRVAPWRTGADTDPTYIPPDAANSPSNTPANPPPAEKPQNPPPADDSRSVYP